MSRVSRWAHALGIALCLASVGCGGGDDEGVAATPTVTSTPVPRGSVPPFTPVGPPARRSTNTRTPTPSTTPTVTVTASVSQTPTSTQTGTPTLP